MFDWLAEQSQGNGADGFNQLTIGSSNSTTNLIFLELF